MAVEEVFTCHNNYFTGVNRLITRTDGSTLHINTRAEGICTAASLVWARTVLKKGRGINALDELPPIPLIIAQMRVVRQYDGNPAKQTEMAGLEMISEHAVTNAFDAAQGFANASPSIGIFWNQSHTMGFRVTPKESEYFDIECGLYRSSNVQEVYEKMEDVTQSYGLPVLGYRLVKLG
jgi:hypothetical protein